MKTIIIHVRKRERDAWRWDSRSLQVQWSGDPLELVRFKNMQAGWPQFASLQNGAYLTGGDTILHASNTPF